MDLPAVQAEENLAVYGLDDISDIHKHPVNLEFPGHFKNLLVVILLFAAVVSVAVGGIIDAAIIIVIVFASVALGFLRNTRLKMKGDSPSHSLWESHISAG